MDISIFVTKLWDQTVIGRLPVVPNFENQSLQDWGLNSDLKIV